MDMLASSNANDTDNEWQYVSTRKRNHRSKSSRSVATHATTYSNAIQQKLAEVNAENVEFQNSSIQQQQTRIDNVLRLVNRATERVRSSIFYQQLGSSLQDIVQKKLDDSHHPSGPHRDVLDIVCYGIGSIAKSVLSQNQLACVVALMNDFGGSNPSPFQINHMCVYDPILTDCEIQVIKRLNMSIIEQNEEGKRKVEYMTLFYMPHCGQTLYNNVLYANWGWNPIREVQHGKVEDDLISQEFATNNIHSKLETQSPNVSEPLKHLGNIIILGNSLKSYQQKLLSRSSPRFLHNLAKLSLKETNPSRPTSAAPCQVHSKSPVAVEKHIEASSIASKCKYSCLCAVYQLSLCNEVELNSSSDVLLRDAFNDLNLHWFKWPSSPLLQSLAKEWLNTPIINNSSPLLEIDPEIIPVNLT